MDTGIKPEQIRRREMKARITVSVITIAVVFAVFFAASCMLGNPSFATMLKERTDALLHYVDAEVINGFFCRPGTYDRITVAVSSISEDAKAEMAEAVNAYYDEMVNNTDAYLDWYYSMSGQWSQIFSMVRGAFTSSIEDSLASIMEEKLSETIAPESDLAITLDSIADSAKAQIRKVTDSIIEESILPSIDGQEYTILITATLKDIARDVAVEMGFNPAIPAVAGSIGGIVSGVVVKNAVKKIMTTAATKIAVKSAAKAMVPAAIGSLAGPIGFVAGTVIGLGIDALGVRLDEAFNRAEYKASIISEINANRMETLAAVDEWIAMQEV